LEEHAMKAFLLAVGVVLTGATCSIPAQAANGTLIAGVTFGSGEFVKGSGRIVDDRRPLSGFSAVRLSGPIDLELRASDRDGVTVRVDDNVVSLIETRVSGGDRPALEIDVRSGAAFRTSRTPVVIVEFRALSELVMRGSGDARADRIETEDFALSMNGSGDARIEALYAARFAAAVSGSGDLVIRSGRAVQQAIRIAGSGDVDARHLDGRGVQVAIAGSGDAAVRASETLDATIAGSGDVIYWGRPRITQSIRGSGTVRRAH
jgi:hypothetical protein